MLTVRELRGCLDDTDLRTKVARAAHRYMATKGYSDARPLGTIDVGRDCTYFYYVLDSARPGLTDLLELEVVRPVDDELGREFVCTVTAYREAS